MSDYTYASISHIKIKSKRLRNFSLIFLVLILFISSFSAIRAKKILDRIDNYSINPVTPFKQNLLLPYNQISFFSSDDKTLLKAWFFSKADSDKVLILSHDFSQNRKLLNDNTAILINKLLDQNYNVLLYDQRGCGNTTNGLFGFGKAEAFDLSGAIRYVSAIGHTQIDLLCLGSGSSAFFNLQDKYYENIHNVILDSPAYSINKIIKKTSDLTGMNQLFFSKTFIKLFSKKNREYSSTLTNLPTNLNILIISSPFSKIKTGEEKKVFNLLKTSNNVMLDLGNTYNEESNYIDLLVNYYQNNIEN